MKTTLMQLRIGKFKPKQKPIKKQSKTHAKYEARTREEKLANGCG